MVAKISGAQRDFSFGEVDPALKRSDDVPARKGGLRQMANARILNSGSLQNRPGRRALFPEQGRVEEVTMSPGNVFYLVFGPGYLRVYNAASVVVFNATLRGAPLNDAIPWGPSTYGGISWAVYQFSVYIAYSAGSPNNAPQILTWDGVSQNSTWTLATYQETVTAGGQKRTMMYRISPPNITMLPSGQTGVINLTFSAPVLQAGMIGTRMDFCGRQITIKTVTNSLTGTATVNEQLFGSERLPFASDPIGLFNLGDEVSGSVSGAKGIVTAVDSVPNTIIVQLIPPNTTFVATDVVGGPGGTLAMNAGATALLPTAVAVWNDEVMNPFRGYPSFVFVDQNRLGFCNFPGVPGGINWSAIGLPTDLYTGANPSDAFFEVAPNKSQVYYVVPGPESSEFVLCDNKIYYIPISPTNPLKPGSVAFQVLSGDGSAPVQPRLAQEAILYANAGQNSVMAIIATGAYNRPFNTKNLSEFHQHLFTNITAIAAPNADGTFNERYAYVLNANGVLAVGKYDLLSLQGNQPVIGWGPWTGVGTVSWISARAANVLMTTTYFTASVVEILDDSQYLDCALLVNSLPAAFAPPLGKGPLWFIPSQTVTLMDQGTRMMGTYQITNNGFIVPQNNGGENLLAATLVAGQPWTMIAEPFCPDASPGQAVGQRMFKRRISRFAVYVVNSTGFLMARLFSGPLTPTSPALGTIMNTYRVPAWNQDDNPLLPPPLREEAQRWRPLGRAFDPRAAIIKDTPGPLLIPEIGIEATI